MLEEDGGDVERKKGGGVGRKTEERKRRVGIF